MGFGRATRPFGTVLVGWGGGGKFSWEHFFFANLKFCGIRTWHNFISILPQKLTKLVEMKFPNIPWQHWQQAEQIYMDIMLTAASKWGNYKFCFQNGGRNIARSLHTHFMLAKLAANCCAPPYADKTGISIYFFCTF